MPTQLSDGKKLFIDIETIPGQQPDLMDRVAEGINPPGNISKKETIEKWEATVKPGLIEKAWRATALNPTLGEIIVIGFAIDNNEPEMFYRESILQPETELLIRFHDRLKERLRDKYSPQVIRRPLWIGTNITGFDLRYIWIRSVINRVCPLVYIPYNHKPWADHVYDIMYEWGGLQHNITSSQDAIAKALGLPGKTGMDGSKVWDMVKEGKIEKVVDYCKDDIIQARKIYHRMNFSLQFVDSK